MTNFSSELDFYIKWRLVVENGISYIYSSDFTPYQSYEINFHFHTRKLSLCTINQWRTDYTQPNLCKKFPFWKMSSYWRLSNVMTTGIDSKVKNSQALDVLLFAFWNSQKLNCKKCFVWNFWYNQSKISKWKDDLLPLYEQTCHHSVVYLFRNHNAFVISASG